MPMPGLLLEPLRKGLLRRGVFCSYFFGCFWVFKGSGGFSSE
jgi:hypothetical protein